jgi:hypothetical protein
MQNLTKQQEAIKTAVLEEVARWLGMAQPRGYHSNPVSIRGTLVFISHCSTAGTAIALRTRFPSSGNASCS